MTCSYRVAIKAFARGQSKMGMLGYILKDEGRPHYDIVSHNVLAREFHVARQVYSSFQATADDNKTILTTKNLFKECHKFHTRVINPAKALLIPTLTYMVQTGEYIGAPEFAMSNRKMDLEDSDRLWHISMFPEESTFTDIKKLFFDPRSYGYKVHLQYLNADRHCKFPMTVTILIGKKALLGVHFYRLQYKRY